MKPFLFELAEATCKENRQLDNLTFVFPNRRAVLYFRKHLSTQLEKPTFAPKLVTIEDFMGGLSSFRVPDKLELIHRLYLCYNRITGKFDPSTPTDAQTAPTTRTTKPAPTAPSPAPG